MTEEDLSVRARFERFPATVKGAFVIRGEDANPHLVSFLEARVVAVAGASGLTIPMKAAVMDCPPHQDVFLPFEFPITDLGPGWYELECDLDVDAVARTVLGGRRFVISWPRASVRRGQVPMRRTLSLAKGTVHLEHLDCASDHAILHYSADGSGNVGISLVADGDRLGVLETDFDQDSGQGWVKTYPLMRSHESLRVEAKARSAGVVAEEFHLP